MKNIPILLSVLKRFFDQKQEQDYSKNFKRMTFENHGCSGYAIYWNGNKSTRFYTEVGGGNCLFYMVIPSIEVWASQTGYSLEERDRILPNVAEESLKKQANLPGSYYRIEEKHIVFYQK